MVADGCIVSGAKVRESLLFSNVTVDECTSIFRSVILPNVEIGRQCTISHAIIDEDCVIPHGVHIGQNLDFDRQCFHVTEKGIRLVTSDMLAKLRGLDVPVAI